MTPLISVIEAAALLEGDDGPVVADVRWTLTGPPGLGDFHEGHLPGAHWVDLDADLSAPHSADGRGGRHPLPDPAAFGAAMRRIGVSSDRTVLVYDARTSLSAARLWWLLTDAGHPDVRVLDGGFAAWTAAGRPTESGPAQRTEPGDFQPRPGRREAFDGDAVAALVTAGGRPVLDVRATERYAATEDPMDPVAGHVPGALSVPSMDNLDADGRFREPGAIRARYADTPDPVLYCGSGITAAHSLLALESAGLPGAIYPGSWSDWITDPSRPVATGPDRG